MRKLTRLVDENDGDSHRIPSEVYVRVPVRLDIVTTDEDDNPRNIEIRTIVDIAHKKTEGVIICKCEIPTSTVNNVDELLRSLLNSFQNTIRKLGEKNPAIIKEYFPEETLEKIPDLEEESLED